MPNNTIIAPEQVVDWYLPVSSPEKGTVFLGDSLPIAMTNHPDLIVFAHQLRKAAEDKVGVEDFRVEVQGSSFRAHSIPALDGTMLAFRKIAQTLPDLTALKMNNAIKSLLTSRQLCKGGLILFSGETGQGKTTTMIASFIQRLKLFGGFCMTVEDPIEVKVPTYMGKGYCVQVEVDPKKEDGYALLLRGALRSYPAASGSMLVIGEIRDPATAMHALKAAVSGHLVIATLHANDVIGAVRRMLSFANAGKDHQANELLASSLRLIVQQRLHHGVINATILSSKDDTTSVAAKIRKGTVELLGDEVHNQNNLVRLGKLEDL